jgi:GNAT superfamily N-acetyltransferase
MFDTQQGTLASVQLRSIRPGDDELVAALLTGLSATSAFHRFLGGLGLPNPALVRGLLRSDGAHGALIALPERGDREEALGHACWSVTPDGAVDVGVLVADGWQGHGIGTALFLAAVDAARTAGGSAVHLDVHPENRRLVAALRRRFGREAFAFRDGLITVDAPVAALSLAFAAAA